MSTSSRASIPEHKVRIVEALKRDGQIAAMTGDGVNDVPALKAAHIGVAMGRRGTDAASEAADMVLTDDDYSTIVRAIRQGRAIHENIVRFAHFLFAGNAGEVLAFALAVRARPRRTAHRAPDPARQSAARRAARCGARRRPA